LCLTSYLILLLMSDAYGLLASFYQPFLLLLFGKDLIYANQAFLEENKDKKVLIIGGGDGVAYKDLREKLQGEFLERLFEKAQK
jgi:spermidine synthase